MALRSTIEWLFDPYLGLEGATWNRWYGCTRESSACSNCLDPNTRVLYADMTWRPIGDVLVGDVLVAFTEAPKRGASRLIEKTVVQAVKRTVAPTVELSVGDRTIIASEDHRWLTDQQRPTWKTTAELTLGMTLKTLGFPVYPALIPNADYRAGYIAGATAGDGTMRWEPEWRSASLGYPQYYWRVAVLADDRAILDRLVEYLAAFDVELAVKPFDGGPTSRRPMLKVETRRLANLARISALLSERASLDWQAGWLAGIFDTDGSYSGSDKYANLRIGQRKNNGVLAACERYAAALGFALKPEKHSGCPTVRLIGTVHVQIAFLTRITPALIRKCEAFCGRRLSGGNAEVNGVRRGPIRELVDIQTAAGTFVAEGIATHNCYIFRQPPLRMRHMRFDKVGIGGKTPIVMADEKVLYKPLNWPRPLLVFPNSLSDLWHGEVHIERTAEMYAVMLLAWWHIYITTTKRSRRQRNWLRSPRFHALVTAALERIIRECPYRIPPSAIEAARAHLAATGPGQPLKPPSNVWVGVTCEANENGDRLRDLSGTPAAVSWASCEPVTDPDLDLVDQLVVAGPPDDNAARHDNGITYYRPPDWFVFGGESGPAAKATALDTEPAPGLRPLDLDHLYLLTRQAEAMGGAVFVKQLGEPWARGVGAASPAGRDMGEWPARLRIRRYPAQLAVRALRFDPGNRLALAALAEHRPSGDVPRARPVPHG